MGFDYLLTTCISIYKKLSAVGDATLILLAGSEKNLGRLGGGSHAERYFRRGSGRCEHKF